MSVLRHLPAVYGNAVTFLLGTQIGIPCLLRKPKVHRHVQ